MNEARRRAYLEAMGFDVWVSKHAAVAAGAEAEAGPARLVIGPGAGSMLLVCPGPETIAGRLAADIVRAVGNDPVWAWPDPDAGTQGPTLAEAVADRLFTRLVVFGDSLAATLFGGSTPEVLGSSAVGVAPGLDDLDARPEARRALWRLIRGRG